MPDNTLTFEFLDRIEVSIPQAVMPCCNALVEGLILWGDMSVSFNTASGNALLQPNYPIIFRVKKGENPGFNTASGNALLQLFESLRFIREYYRFNTASGNALLQLKPSSKIPSLRRSKGFNTASGNALLQLKGGEVINV